RAASGQGLRAGRVGRLARRRTRRGRAEAVLLRPWPRVRPSTPRLLRRHAPGDGDEQARPQAPTAAGGRAGCRGVAVRVAGASTMRAAVLREHGGPEAFEYAEIERREPGEDEILVRVLACALNHLDIFVRRGMPGVPLPLPHVAGGDVAGRVVKAGGADGEHLVGAAVLLDPMVGRHALGENLWGGLAEYVVAPAANAIVLTGHGDGLERYAALPIAYGTARRMLVERARVQAGETVVVLGAAGGVGVACVQLGSRLDARVIACSSSEEKLGRLSELGAETTVDTR